ncbi:MAG TPA: hypothetical protein VGR67_16480 [Candidatus Polarisedimenticolia bacterium]|nr:hypothetical protein [Candidatus Polarisedimenticolia bacterium]
MQHEGVGPAAARAVRRARTLCMGRLRRSSDDRGFFRVDLQRRDG